MRPSVLHVRTVRWIHRTLCTQVLRPDHLRLARFVDALEAADDPDLHWRYTLLSAVSLALRDAGDAPGAFTRAAFAYQHAEAFVVREGDAAEVARVLLNQVCVRADHVISIRTAYVVLRSSLLHSQLQTFFNAKAASLTLRTSVSVAFDRPGKGGIYVLPLFFKACVALDGEKFRHIILLHDERCDVVAYSQTALL